ncbi:MAG: TetR/AcrR family transcriptional regulator [Hyphomonas sp.]
MAKETQITKGELYRLVWQEPITALAKRFEVSPNGLAKICDRVDIDRPPKGYWASQSDPKDLPALDEIVGADDLIQIGGKRHSARRRQTRMSPEERREQIMDYAKQLVIEQGVHHVSLRSIARQIGISEAQAYNCFDSRTSLLVDLCMRELDAFEDERQKMVARGSDRVTRVMLSTLLYIQVAADRGVIAQRLMAISEVRVEVERKRLRAREAYRKKQVGALVEDRGISDERAFVEVGLLGHLTLRAGGLVSLGKLTTSQAQLLILPTILKTATTRGTPSA